MPLSQKPFIGKPPERERPPSSFQGGMRRIVYFEQPQPSFEDVTREKPLTESEFEARAGVDVTLPEGAKIIGVTSTPKGYELSYEWLQPGAPQLMAEWITKEQLIEGLGTKYTALDLARIAVGDPEFLAPPQAEILKQSGFERVGFTHQDVLAYQQRHLVDVKDLWAIGKTGDVESLKGLSQLYGTEVVGVPKEALITKITPTEITYAQTEKISMKTELQGEPYVFRGVEHFGKPDVGLVDIDLSKWWAETPSVADVNREMAADMSGRAYAWTAMDVYNIVSTGLLVATAVHSIINLPSRLALAKSVGAREAIRQQIFIESPEEQFVPTFGKQVEPTRVWEQPTKTFWQNIQAPLEVKPQIESWMVEEAREAVSYQPTIILKHAIWRGGIPEQIVTPIAEKSMWIMSPALKEISMVQRIYPSLVSPKSILIPFMLTKPETPTRLREATATTPISLAGVRAETGISQALITRLEPLTTTHQATLQQQRTTQLQKQLQMTRQLRTQMQMQKQTFSDDWLMPKKMRRRGKDTFGLWSRYKRQYPVMTGTEVMRIDRRKVKFL